MKGSTKMGLIWLLCSFLHLQCLGFDRTEFERRLAKEPESGQARLLTQTARKILFSHTDLSLTYAQQAVKMVEQTDDRALQGEALVNLALAFKMKESFPSALDTLRKAFSRVEETGDRKQLARVNGYIGLILSDMGDLIPSIDYAERALKYYRETDDLTGIAMMTNNIGARYYKLGDYSKSLDYLFASLKTEEERNFSVGMANNLNCIGINYIELRDQERAQLYLNKALTLYGEMGESSGYAKTLNNLGISYKAQEAWDKALACYRQAYDRAKSLDNRVLQSEILNNIGEIDLKRGALMAALEAYNGAFDLALESGDHHLKTATLINIAEIHLRQGRNKEAIKLLTRANDESQTRDYKELWQASLELLSAAQKAQGQYRMALASLEERNEVREKVLDEEKQRAMAELEARYQLDQKEKALILASQKEALKGLELKTTRQRLYLSLLLVLLLMIGLVWLGKRHRTLYRFWSRKTYVGPYQIADRLGGGGIGDVYKAFSVRDGGTPVAVKLLREGYTHDPVLRQRFLNEARIIDQLDHPNIVKVYERGECNDRLYLAMEFIDGKTLDQVISESPRLPIDFCVEVMRQLLEAITALHEQGVLHRDLKPENVMLLQGEVKSPRVKLMDFDLARDLRLTPLTQTGELLGTLPYMPPERISLQLSSEKGELYALGVLFYEMVTGQKPFPADSPVEVMRQILDLTPVAVDHLRQEIPTTLAALIMNLLDKDPEKRPDSSRCMEFLRA